MKTLAILFSTIFVASANAEKPQRAKASWLTIQNSADSSAVIQTVIKMQIEDGWHTYWVNPGEGGLPLSINAKLPEGWTFGKIQYPAPIRFFTGDLPGFGYEGEVRFALDVHPPKDFKGELPAIKATLSWLTCNDETCLPGKAEIQLTSGDNGELIKESYGALPKTIPGATLTITDAAKLIQITLKLPADSKIDPSAFEIFPATADIIDASAKPTFLKDPKKPNIWITSAPKSEYLTEKPEKLSIVLKDKTGNAFVISTH